jgi:hypothetical protein
MSSRNREAARPGQPASSAVDSPAASSFSQPELQNEAHGFRNPRIPGNPATQGAGIDPKSLGRLHLVQAQASKDETELLRRHGHSVARKLLAPPGQGKLPQLASVFALSRGAICPTFSSRWPVVRSKRRGDRSREPSGCLRSSRTNCASWLPALCLVTTRFGRSWRHGAGCGSPWPRSGRPPMRFAPGLGSSARVGSARRCVWYRLILLPWPCVPLRYWFGRSGAPYGLLCGWSMRCERSGRDSAAELGQALPTRFSVRAATVR